MPNHARLGPVSPLKRSHVPSGLVLFSMKPWVRNSGVDLPRVEAIRSRAFQNAESWSGLCWLNQFSASQSGEFSEARLYAGVSPDVPGVAAIASYSAGVASAFSNRTRFMYR